MKVAINTCHGMFNLSPQAVELYRKKTNLFCCKIDTYFYNDRANKNLIEVIEELGDDADGDFAKLKIVEVPDDVKWHISEYDGIEWVAEDHRTWE